MTWFRIIASIVSIGGLAVGFVIIIARLGTIERKVDILLNRRQDKL